MDTSCREKPIRSIIKMEERIVRCQRCPALIRCTSRPSLGKGELEPDVLLVFECESDQTRDTKWIIELRNMIRRHFHLENVYHTFMVRCHPKSCILNHGNNYGLTTKLLNPNNICLLNNHLCDGIRVKPSDIEVINCIYFLLEEIEILRPQYVILFGSRVEDFVLKSYGIFDNPGSQNINRYETTTLLTTVENRIYKEDDIQRLAALANIV